MKLSELQDELEDLQNKLTVIYETANALEITQERGELTSEQANWILDGIIENIEKSEEKAGKLVEEVIKMCSILKSL